MSRSFHNILCILGLAAAFSFTPAKNEAFYTSVKSSGMAGAVTAYPLDALSSAYNPGGLGFSADRWDLGVHVANYRGKTSYYNNPYVDGSFNSHKNGEYMAVPEFGINVYTTNSLFTWGFVIYNSSFHKTNYPYANPLYGTSKLGLEYWHAVAGPTGSVIINKNHCIGFSIDLHGQRLKINGLQNFATRRYSSHPHKVTNKGYDYSGGVSATIGWMSKVSDCLSIGAAYSPEVRMSHFRDYQGLVADHGMVNIPQRAVGGVAIKMLCNFTVTFDIEHINYNYIRAISDSLLDHHYLKYHELGKEKASGLGWMDQTIFRTGFDWIIDKSCSFRAGYCYQRSPIRASQTFANALIPYVAQMLATFGGSWKYCNNELSFYGAYAFRHTKHGHHAIPHSLGGGGVDLTEDQWMAGLSWGRLF